MNSRIRLSENFHVLLWLIKDSCWMLEFETLGTAMVFPAISMAMYIAWKCRTDWQHFFPNMAVLFWICANSIWMMFDFYQWNSKPLAFVFFIAGFCMIAIYLFKLFFQKQKPFNIN